MLEARSGSQGRFILVGLVHDFSVLAFTKTWLKPKTHRLEFLPACVHAFREDRPNKIAGGVFIGVSSVFVSYCIF